MLRCFGDTNNKRSLIESGYYLTRVIEKEFHRGIANFNEKQKRY